ncbi:uncharacterized protein J8A68_000752 [[Candida] subhashii]|uniref:Uncharacterized protein n=1 Tax=[Candida] subhashii TaxID=561895 RepID=A0A8J5UU31_9ASCO|nr:uncharacterized protein J8A68_000752 [[Candida] subhashii]KAG7665732.1 hypothetical protein J8A68_000752 [[Candida] subhashii]
MGRSFYEKEQEKIRNLIKLPLLELVLKFLPHLQLTQKETDDTWEIVAIQLSQIQFSEAINDKKTTEEIDAIPELNGIYVRQYFESMYEEFTKNIQRGIMEWNQVEALTGNRGVPFWYNPSSRADAILYQLYQLRGRDIEIMGIISSENLENKIRRQLKKELKVGPYGLNGQGEEVQNEKENADDIEEDDKLLESTDLLQEYKRSSEKQRNEILRQELIRKDKRIEQLTQENKRLLELNHDLLRLQ